MTSRIDAHTLARQIAQEHAELRLHVQSVNETLADQANDAVAVGEVFRSLADQLKSHFAEEEDGGYFREAVGIAPRLSDTVAKLKQQHAALLKMLGELISQWEAKGEESTAIAGFQDFQSELWKHEGEEDDLLQTAFTDDIGDSD